MSSFTKIYWRSSGVPAWGLIVLMIAALIALLAVENVKETDPIVDENYATMVTAAKIMRQGMEVIRPLRAEKEPINPEFDPQRSGFV
ncbi:MAG: poly-gamma-glutamate system protein, partial [Pseudomonadota bacterium]|nr:poly-gamma-glutamate system protein [Pseudomonadota bacterium]